MENIIKAMLVLAELSNEVHQDLDRLVDESGYEDTYVITSRMVSREMFAYFGEMLEKAADRLERESKESVSDDGWIKWDGGDIPPVKRGTKVLVRHRDGDEFIGFAGMDGAAHIWKHDAGLVAYGDIIAYKVI